MRELLVEARAAGEPSFDAAWEVAWVTMRREKSWPHATTERHDWQAALIQTRPEFARCWDGLPSPFQRVSSTILARVLGPEEIVADDGVVVALVLG